MKLKVVVLGEKPQGCSWLRKLLASSTMAIAGALNSLLLRLEKTLKEKEKRFNVQSGHEFSFEENSLLKEDYETLEVTEDEWDEEENTVTKESIEVIRDEITDLRNFFLLANKL